MGPRKELERREAAQTRVHSQLNRLMIENPPILGLDGNPTDSYRDKIEGEIYRMLREYALMPTLQEWDALPALRDGGHQDGASLSLMSLLALSVFQPVKAELAELGPISEMIPQVFTFLLGYLSARGEEGVSTDEMQGVITDLMVHIHVGPKTLEGETVILPQEEIDAAKQHMCSSLVLLLALRSVVAGVFQDTDDHLKITPLGDRVFRHMIAVNKWLIDVQEALQSPETPATTEKIEIVR